MREMIREAKPIPKPSRAPEAVTEREESRKPALMMRRASPPARMVAAFYVNRAIRGREAVRQMTVPRSIMAAHMTRVVL